MSKPLVERKFDAIARIQRAWVPVPAILRAELRARLDVDTLEMLADYLNGVPRTYPLPVCASKHVPNDSCVVCGGRS